MKGNGTKAKIPQRGKSPNNSKVRVLNPREILSRRKFLLKGANPREMLMPNPKERVSIVMKWGITPRIAPNLNRGVGFLRDFPQLHNQESAKRMELPLEELKAPMEVHFADGTPHPTKL
jgi:hypothetical protein